jgi:excisionase family DNA binding protein
MNSNERTELLGTEQVAQMLGRTRATICRWAREGKLPAISMPDGHAFRAEDIEAWIEARKTGGGK